MGVGLMVQQGLSVLPVWETLPVRKSREMEGRVKQFPKFAQLQLAC